MPDPRKVVGGYFLSLDGVAEAPDQFVVIPTIAGTGQQLLAGLPPST